MVYLHEQKVTRLWQSPTLADEIALMHKSVFNKHDSSSRHGFYRDLETRVQVLARLPTGNHE